MDHSLSQARCWPIHRWPQRDRDLWAYGQRRFDPFDDDHECVTWRPDSWEKARKGYGRWLDFLAGRGWLEVDTEPYDRVNRTRLMAYYKQLRLNGNSDTTIIGRFAELAMAMRVLAPGQESGWIRKPFGPTMHALLPNRTRAFIVPGAETMLAWGYSLLEEARTKVTERERLVAFRDGLLVTLLATCARRLRAVSSLRIGHEIIRVSDGYRIELPPELVKTKKQDHFDLPRRFTPFIYAYLTEVRPKLLCGRTSAHFWINSKGQACTPKLIQARILELSKRRFGVAFGPHRFRHSIATSAPHLDPTNPTTGAEILGISPSVVQAHYNRATQAKAIVTYAQSIEARTAAAEALQEQGDSSGHFQPS